MNKFIVTYDWTARAIISMKGEDEEDVRAKLLEVFPSVEIISVRPAPSDN